MTQRCNSHVCNMLLLAAGFLLVQSADRAQAVDMLEFETLLQLQLGSGLFSSRFVEEKQTTQFFYEQHVERHSSLNVNTDLDWYRHRRDVHGGYPWIVEDLDGDGVTELVIQRIFFSEEEPRGFLDIRSAPDWRLRTTIPLPGNEPASAITVELDGDASREVFLTPARLSFTEGWAAVVDYDPVGDEFFVRSIIDAPERTIGPSVAADFDQDGRVEFICGNWYGHVLFEWDDGLHYRGRVESEYSQASRAGCSKVQLHPDAPVKVLLSRSSFANGYESWLMNSVGDNQFETFAYWNEETGYSGNAVNHSLDLDRDGNDEFILSFHPNYRIFEWDNNTESIEEVANWSQDAYGTPVFFSDGDLDRDGINELWLVAHDHRFWALEQVLDPASVPGDETPPRIQLSMVPNPATDRGTLLWRGAGPEGMQSVALIDVNGRIRRSWGPQTGSMGELVWDLSDEDGVRFPVGRYWLRARDAEGEFFAAPVVVSR